METAEQVVEREQVTEARQGLRPGPAASDDGKPVWVEPDLDFIRSLAGRGGNLLKQCMQCGTCSGTCDITPDAEPFPRREMAWAVWGLKDRLLGSPNVWLCHQCNDCSKNCPRGARPGDVLAAVRQECVEHYAVPHVLGTWVNRPYGLPLLLGIPTALLTLALAVRDPIEKTLGISRPTDDRLLYAYSGFFPHWLLNTFFAFFGILTLLALMTGVVRFWRAMAAAVPVDRSGVAAPGLVRSIGVTLKRIILHEKFAQCTEARSRHVSHLCVFFGFVALSLVTIWVITARYNPLIRDDFVYPFGFWNPWKLLANAGGVALLVGCLLMARERLRDNAHASAGNYFDWALISGLLLVTLTGFATEVLHYVRLEPHRHIAYFVHLVFVFTVLMYLPYSKLAHLAYRATAMVFVEHSGRNGESSGSLTDRGGDAEQKGMSDVGETGTRR